MMLFLRSGAVSGIEGLKPETKMGFGGFIRIAMPTTGTRTIRRIAQMYYSDNMNIRQITMKTGLCPATVSRCLAKARDSGIVKIHVEQDDTEDMEKSLEDRFGLKECFVTAALDSTEALYRSFARPVGELIVRHTPAGGLLGVSWGDTLSTAAMYLPKDTWKKIDAIPVIGSMGAIESGVYPANIAKAFAEALGGQAYLVNIPAVYENENTARRMREDRAFQPVLEHWRRLDTVILGASSLDSDTSMCKREIFTQNDLQTMKNSGCRAAVNFVMLDSQGSILEHPLKNRIVNLPLENLKKVRTVILAAGGPGKAAPILSVIRSGMAHCLVTDEETAATLLENGQMPCHN